MRPKVDRILETLNLKADENTEREERKMYTERAKEILSSFLSLELVKILLGETKLEKSSTKKSKSVKKEPKVQMPSILSFTKNLNSK